MPLRVRMLALIDGAGSGAYIATVGVLLTSRFGVATAGWVLAAGSLGRVLSLLWAGRISNQDSAAPHRAYTAATALMTLGAVGGMVAAAFGPAVLVGVLCVVSSMGNNLTSTLAATARDGQMVAFYPVLMVGGALGASAASTVLAAGWPLWPLLLLVAAQLVEPRLIGPFLRPLGPRPPAVTLARDVLRVGALAACSYGPLAVYSALVAASLGPAMVGPAMVAYAIGASVASRVDGAMSVRFGWYRADGWRVTVLLSALGVGSWALAGSAAGLLSGRAASGVLMFLAQGRLLRALFRQGGAARVAAASTGLGLGAGAGAVLASSAAELFGTAAMAVGLAAATLSLALVPALRPTPEPGAERTR